MHPRANLFIIKKEDVSMNSKKRVNRNIRRRRKIFYLRLGILLAQIILFVVVSICVKDLISFGKNLNYSNPISMDETRISVIDSSDKNSLDSGSDALLMLVNADHLIPEGYTTEITPIQNDQSVASICYKDLQEMMDDCRAAGLNPVICSSYRSMEKQQRLYQEQVQKYINHGYSPSDAKEKASSAVAIPGTSEHELGLAVDIVDINNQRLETAQENTPVQRWLMENSWKYGFILRYPSDKTEITGIMYEPWHYRYVGREAARYIYEHDLCLEEYLGIL